jgi:hypothetical protein
MPINALAFDCTPKSAGYAFLGGIGAVRRCAASRQEVVARLGQEYIGQNVDTLVVRFGPPTSVFKMNSGQSSYIWQLSAVTDIATDRGYGTASTRFCKVSVITSPAGIVQQLDTEDQNAGVGVPGLLGVYGSMCGQRLGMRPQG